MDRTEILDYDDGAIDIFGCSGFVKDGEWFYSSKNWVYKIVEPYSVKQSLEKVLHQLVESKIQGAAIVKITPNLAVYIYLEGYITPKMIEQAEVSENKVLFRGVEFLTIEGIKELDVMVVPEYDPMFNILDVNQKLVFDDGTE